MAKKEGLKKFNKARFADNAKKYTVLYRDFKKIKEITLSEFIKESNNFQTIPITRIETIKKNHRILFEKNSQSSDQIWESLKKLKPFKMKWQRLRSTKLPIIISGY